MGLYSPTVKSLLTGAGGGGGGGGGNRTGSNWTYVFSARITDIILNVAVVLDDNTDHVQAYLAYYSQRDQFAEI